MATIGEGLVLVFPPPPVRGMALADFALMIEDRRGRGFPALQQAHAGSRRRGRAAAGTHRPLQRLPRRRTAILCGHRPDQGARCSTFRWKTFSRRCRLNSGSVYVNDLNLFGRTFRVIAQAEAAFREDPEDIGELRTRSATGALPFRLEPILSIEPRTGPSRVERYNLYPAAALDGDTAPGFSSGQALSAMEEVALRTLPDGFGFGVGRRSPISRYWPEIPPCSSFRFACCLSFFSLLPCMKAGRYP